MTETKNNTQNKIDEKHQEALDLMIKREELLASSARKGLREARAVNEGIFKAKEKILTVERQILKDAIAEGKVLSKNQVKKKAVMEGGKGAVKQGLGLTEGDKIFSGRGLANMLGKGLQGAMHVAGAATENPLFNLGANALGQRSSRIDAARENVYQEDQSKLNSGDENDTEETEAKQQSSGGDGGELKTLAQTRNDILLKGFGMLPTSGQFEEFNDNLIDLNETEGDILENAEEQLEDKKLGNDDVKKTEKKPGALAKVQKDNKKADKEDKEGGPLDNAADMLTGMNALKTMLSTGPLMTLLGVAGPIALAVAGIAAVFGGINWLDSWQKGLTEDREKERDARAEETKAATQKEVADIKEGGGSIKEQQLTLDKLIKEKEKAAKKAKDDAGWVITPGEQAKIDKANTELGVMRTGRASVMTPEEQKSKGESDKKEKEEKEIADQKFFENLYEYRKKIGYGGEGTEDYEHRKKIKEDAERAKKPKVPLTESEALMVEVEPAEKAAPKVAAKAAPKAVKSKKKSTSFAERIKDHRAKMEKEMDGGDYQEIPDDLKNQHKGDWGWAVGATDEEIAESERRAAGRKKINDANAAITKKEDDSFYKESKFGKDLWDDNDGDNWEDSATNSVKKGKGKKTTKSTSSRKVTETVTGGKEHVSVRSHEKYAPSLKNGGIDPTTGEKSVLAYDRQYGEKVKTDLYKSRKSRFDDQWDKIKDTDEMKGASKRERLRAKTKISRSIREGDKETVANKRNAFLKNAKEHGGNYAYSEASKEAERTKNAKENGNQAVVIPAPAAAPAPAPKPSGGGNISTSDNHNFGNKLMDNM